MSEAAIRRGDLVVREDGSVPTLIRVKNVTPSARIYVGGARFAIVLAGVMMVHGRQQPVESLPVDQYRHATDDEEAAARDQGTLPPALTP